MSWIEFLLYIGDFLAKTSRFYSKAHTTEIPLYLYEGKPKNISAYERPIQPKTSRTEPSRWKICIF